jgi:hypothetical protein
MKTTLALLAIATLTGCTGLKSPDGWEYKNGIFQKQFSELTIEKTTSGTNSTFKAVVKGWKSDGAAMAEAVASGVAKGLKP